MRWGRETSFVGCTQTPKMAAGVQRQPRRAHQKSPNWFRETTELINWGAKAGCEVEDMAGAEGHPVKQGLDGEAQCVGCNASLPRITNRGRGGWGEEEKVWNALRAFILRWDRYQSGFDFNHAMPIPAIVTYQIWIHQLLQQPPFVWWEQIINGPIFVHQRGRGAGGGLYLFWHIGDIKCDDRVHWLFSHYMITHQDLSAITTWQGRHQKQLSFP